jgi:hypothetical protein
VVSSFCNLLFSFLEWVPAVFAIQYVRPDEFIGSIARFFLNFQFCFRFKPYPKMRLIIIRTIEAAIIKVELHSNCAVIDRELFSPNDEFTGGVKPSGATIG